MSDPQITHAITGPSAPTTISSTSDGLLEIVIVSVDSEQATVALCGEFDAATAYLLRNSLTSLLAAGRRTVCLDLSRVTFIDCAGLALLTWAHERFTRADGALVLTRISDRVARLLSICDLDRRLLVIRNPAPVRSDRHLNCVPALPTRATPPGPGTSARGGPSNTGDPTAHPTAPVARQGRRRL